MQLVGACLQFARWRRAQARLSIIKIEIGAYNGFPDHSRPRRRKSTARSTARRALATHLPMATERPRPATSEAAPRSNEVVVFKLRLKMAPTPNFTLPTISGIIGMSHFQLKKSTATTTNRPGQGFVFFDRQGKTKRDGARTRRISHLICTSQIQISRTQGMAGVGLHMLLLFYSTHAPSILRSWAQRQRAEVPRGVSAFNGVHWGVFSTGVFFLVLTTHARRLFHELRLDDSTQKVLVHCLRMVLLDAF